MRLYNYLNEQYRYSKKVEQKTINKSKKIIKKRLKETEKQLFWYDFNVTLRKLCMIMSSIFMQDKIRMIDDGENYINSFKFVKGSDFYKNGDVEIFITSDVIGRMKMLHNEGNLLSMNDRFHNELLYVISHVLSEKQRVLRVKDEFQFVGYQPLRKFIIDNMDHYVEQIKDELEESGFSATKSLIHDLIGRREEYKDFLNKLD